jgi:DNA-directed RNA polymerase subunit RPC12/RpoP
MPITYKCPSCGAAMVFDSRSQELSCPQCNNEIGIDEYKRIYGNRNNNDVDNSFENNRSNTNDNNYQNNQTRDFNNGNMKIYHCQSCGAELVADEYTSATICSFCGNPSLVEDRLNGAFRPEMVIPFKINKEQAVASYKKWLKKGLLTPKTLSTQAVIDKISGIYAPFWLYDYYGESDMHASAEKVRREERGDTEYIYTDHFRVYRNVSANFEKIPADASEKMDDNAMDKLEPYNYGELVPFEMPYLSGYLSERYNYTDKDMLGRVEPRVRTYISDIARSTINGYSSVSVTNNHVTLNNIHNQYALMPVWMLNCRYNGKDFQFLLNGQTGKIVADRPISMTRAAVWWVVIFIITLIITMLGGLWLW